jgi:hypothetical protein
MCLVARVCSAMPCSDVVWCVHMSRDDLDLVSYTEDLLSEIKTANRSNFLTHKPLNRKGKRNRVLWLAALGLGAAAGVIRGQRAGHRCRLGAGRLAAVQIGAEPASRRRCRADRGGSNAADGRRPCELQEAAMAPFGGGATAREGCAGVSVVAALGDVKVGRGAHGGRRRRTAVGRGVRGSGQRRLRGGLACSMGAER